MSQDLLVTSTHPVTAGDLASAMGAFSDQVSLRADDTGTCTVVVDAHDTALVWIAASQPAHDPEAALRRAGLKPDVASGPAPGWVSRLEPGSHWTEVVQPANLHTPASLVDAASVAHSIATVVGGTTQSMSRVQGTEPAGGSAAPPVRDSPCDLLTESCAIFLQTRPVLAFTPWVAMAMDWARGRGLTPTFLTPGTTQLSPVLHHFATRGGCLWIRQGAEGMHNGATGRAAAWDGSEFVDSEATPWRASAGNVWDVVIESERLRQSTGQGHIGDFVQGLHDACALEQPRSWGVCEPTDRAWDVVEVGAHSRSAYQGHSRILFRSAAVEGLAIGIPQPIGTHEQVVCIGRADHLLPRATTLRRMGEHLLRAGSDLSVLGYRQPTLTQPDHPGYTGNVLPGVIGFVPARFGGFDASAMAVDPDSGADIAGIDVGVTAYGVVVAFGLPTESCDDASAALIAAWDRTLAALAERDSVRAISTASAAGGAVERA